MAAVDRVDNDNTVTGIGHDDDHYRSHHGTTYGSTGKDYDTYQPSYQYGNDLSRDTRYSTGDYSTHESSIREDFTTRNPGSSYDDHSQAIRTGYDRGRTATESGAALGGTTSEVKQGTAAETALGGNGVPGIQTGGTSYDGTTPDTRGVTEKIADKLTGDHTDDKTGKTV
ncbi:hypothetical protein EON77_01395 [bacterium]|nr:MAG: hypothetical protein EON77_01395 [bacterium]